MKTGRKRFGRTAKMILKRLGTKALAAGLPFGRLADRSPPSPEDGNKHQCRRAQRDAYRRSESEERKGSKPGGRKPRNAGSVYASPGSEAVLRNAPYQ